MCSSIDLHIHSHYSDDGEFSPTELVRMCCEQFIYIFAITDHNTVKGVEEAIDCAGRWQRRCFPAIEIDCVHKGLHFHVLGYNIDYRSRDFEAIEQNVRRQSKHASRECLRLVNRLGFDVPEDVVQAHAQDTFWPESWTGELIAEVLLTSDKYRSSPLLYPYIAGDRSDNPYVNFYWDYCAPGKPCHVDIAYPDMQDVVTLIHRNGGQAVLAHPGVNLAGRWAFLDEIIPLGIDGLEVYSSYHDCVTASWFAKKAQESLLFPTRGSDFHGKTKPSVRLGCAEKVLQRDQAIVC